MNLFRWQVVFSCSIFITIVLCSLLPAVLLRQLNGSSAESGETSAFQTRVFSWLNCLTGGVFLAMCFLSLLPNVQHHFVAALTTQTAAEHDNTFYDRFPIAECVVLIGFFITLTVEQWSRQCATQKQSRSLSTSRLVEMDSLLNNDEAQRTLLGGDEDDVEVVNEVVQQEPNDKKSGHSHHDHAIALLQTSSKGLRFVFLLFAVIAHAFFEGIVLGLQDDVAKAIRLFVAILVHEAVVAAILGFNITRAKLSKSKVFAYSLIFAVTIPVGVWVGMGVGQTPGPAGHYVSGTLQGVAAGMFLHITFMQLLPEEFDHNDDGGLLKTLFLFTGFLILLVLNAAMGGHH